MEETKIIVGENKLTDSEMEGMENFDQLLTKHQQYKWERKLKIGGLIAAGAFVLGTLLLFFFSTKKEVKEAEQTTNLTEEKALNKPFDVKLVRDTFIVISELGGEFTYKNTKIIIPENAFVDSNGSLIKGEVKITYKEFHTAAEAFVAGIPMTYDSTETEFHFETAGMFEIRGFKNGESILLSKPIEVQLASLNEANRFNQYYFDEVEDEWNYIKRDSIIKPAKLELVDKKEISKKLKQVSAELKSIKDDSPKAKAVNSVCVKLEIDETEFPEFTSLKEVLFEVNNVDEERYKQMSTTEFDDVKLKKNKNEFELHFYKKFKKTVLKVIPVYEGNAFEKALELYNTKNGEKIKDLTNRRKELNETLSSVVNEVQFGSSPESFVTRIFMANQFGIFNSDCPQRMPRGQTLLVEYFNKKDEAHKDTLKLQSLYLVEEDQTTLYTLRPNSTLSFNPQNKCALWGVTTDQKLVIITAKDFLKIPKRSNSVCNLEFELVEENMFSEENVIKKLKIEALFDSI